MEMEPRVAVPRSLTCTCCDRRGVRKMIRLRPERPIYIAVCPPCDTNGAINDRGIFDLYAEDELPEEGS